MGLVHGPGPWGSLWTRSMGCSMDPDPCFVVLNTSFREWWCQDIDQVLLYEIFFFLSVFSISKMLGRITSIWNKLLTAACWSREKKIGNFEASPLVEATSVLQTLQTNHSQYSSPVDALNLVIESKSQPGELVDSRTIELHVASRRKKSLQSPLFCGF